MDTQLVQDIIACLPGERTLFHYYRDRYAVYLLEQLLSVKGRQKINHLRQSRFARLLNKPCLANAMAANGSGYLALHDLNGLWPSETIPYVLTLDRWSEKKNYQYDQVSRPGSNLVLQLNFNRQHDHAFRKNVAMDVDDFCFSGHPICQSGRNTLAWARIDLDFDRNEALIEEIQTDWLRDAKTLYERGVRAARQKREHFYFYGENLSVKKVAQYYNESVRLHERTWHEAILTAAIWFIREELGITRIFYHTFETGRVLKNLKWSSPPKSLYSELPRKFCFERVDQGPGFIETDKRAQRRLKKIKQPQWYRLVI